MRSKTAVIALLLSVVNLGALVMPPAWAQSISNTFSFTARTYLPFPVVAIRPVQPGQVAAVDVMPSAGAVENSDNGFAWFDACDADILHANGGIPVTCARVGIRSDGAEFGTRSFDGPANKPVWIVVNRQRVAKFDSTGLTVFGTVRAQAYAN